MPIPLPLDNLFNQGVVFHHNRLDFPEGPRSKYLIYLNNKIFPEPLFLILATTDKNRKIPTLPTIRQNDILVIPPGELEFFKSSDHTFLDINNFREIEKHQFQTDYMSGDIQYIGLLSNDIIEQIKIKVQNSKILRPKYKKIILGF